MNDSKYQYQEEYEYNSDCNEENIEEDEEVFEEQYPVKNKEKKTPFWAFIPVFFSMFCYWIMGCGIMVNSVDPVSSEDKYFILVLGLLGFGAEWLVRKKIKKKSKFAKYLTSVSAAFWGLLSVLSIFEILSEGAKVTLGNVFYLCLLFGITAALIYKLKEKD